MAKVEGVAESGRESWEPDDGIAPDGWRPHDRPVLDNGADGRDGCPGARCDPGEIGVVHATVPGRTRLRIPGLLRTPSLKAAIERSVIAAHPAVARVTANPLTGTVLILHRPDLPWQAAAATIAGVIATHPAGSATADGPAAAGTAQGLQTRTLVAEPVAAVLARLDVRDAEGLSEAQAAARRRRVGDNVLAAPEGRSLAAAVRDQVATPPVALLAVSAAISIATGGLIEAAAILGVVVVNAVVGVVTERQAERTIDVLRNRPLPPALVVRQGRPRPVPAGALVPGDLLILVPGQAVAADARLVEASRLSVDESALTGESVPVIKQSAPITDPACTLSNCSNMVFMGTTVTGGSGRAVVVGTGRRTELGAVQALLGSTHPPPTPTQVQLADLARRMAILCGLVCGAVFALGLLRGFPLIRVLQGAITLGVAAVPEGLPAVATTALAIGVRTLRRDGINLRRLGALETLGAVETLCLDKTGTLTQNRMAVAHLATATAVWDVAAGGAPAAAAAAAPELAEMMRIAVLCRETADGDGSPTERALTEAAAAIGVAVAAERQRWPCLRIEHRTETSPLLLTLHRGPDGAELTAVKGAPEVVLAHCRRIRTGSGLRPLTSADRRSILAANDWAAAAALRVLGVAGRAGWPTADARDTDGLVWLGLIGMADPVRAGIPALIAGFHRAGIRTVMVTGDQPSTAAAVAAAIGLTTGRPPATGRAPDVPVFARVSPSDKLRIVRALQADGRVVAMTGDGINDGPALRAADIGIALGRSGTDVACSAADLVLGEDDLAPVLSAVARGRGTRINIRKAVRFLLATNLSEIEVTLAAYGLGLVEPPTPIQLLWINLITDLFPALALALDPVEADVLEGPPSDPHRPLFSGPDLPGIALDSGLMAAAAMGAAAYGRWRHGPGPRGASIGFNALVSAQLLYALAVRSPHRAGVARPPNHLLTAGIGLSLLGQFLAGTLPGLRALLGTVRPAPLDALAAVVAGVLPLVITAALKRRSGPGHTAPGRRFERAPFSQPDRSRILPP